MPKAGAHNQRTMEIFRRHGIAGHVHPWLASEQLDNLLQPALMVGQQLGGPFQSELQSTLNGMNQKVQASSSYWVARNADQFRNDFAQFVSKCEQQLNQILQEAAKASGQHLQAIQSATGSAI